GGDEGVVARGLELDVRPGLGRGASGLASRDDEELEGAAHGGPRRTKEARRLASLRGGSPPGHRASGPRASPPGGQSLRGRGQGTRALQRGWEPQRQGLVEQAATSLGKHGGLGVTSVFLGSEDPVAEAVLEAVDRIAIGVWCLLSIFVV